MNWSFQVNYTIDLDTTLSVQITMVTPGKQYHRSGYHPVSTECYGIVYLEWPIHSVLTGWYPDLWYCLPGVTIAFCTDRVVSRSMVLFTLSDHSILYWQGGIQIYGTVSMYCFHNVCYFPKVIKNMVNFDRYMVYLSSHRQKLSF